MYPLFEKAHLQKQSKQTVLAKSRTCKSSKITTWSHANVYRYVLTAHVIERVVSFCESLKTKHSMLVACIDRRTA